MTNKEFKTAIELAKNATGNGEHGLVTDRALVEAAKLIEELFSYQIQPSGRMMSSRKAEIAAMIYDR